MGGNIMSAGNVKKTFQRNGKIELLRFIFCMAVLLFHCEKYVLGEPSLEKGYHLSLFCHGSMGVEFFFLVSGFLMAKSISKKIRMQTELQETLAGKPYELHGSDGKSSGKHSELFLDSNEWDKSVQSKSYHLVYFMYADCHGGFISTM